MRRVLLAMLLLVSLSFAAWQGIAATAMVVSAALLAAMFVVGHGFGIREITILAKDELYQILVLAVLIVALTGSEGILNVFSEAFSDGTSENLQELSISIVDTSIANLSADFMQIVNDDKWITDNAAKSLSCNVMKIGYSVSGCGGFSMISPSLSTAGSLVGFALGELHALKKLLVFGNTFGLTLILPVGIILRTFRFSRGAGGFLMALGVGLYIMLPLGVVFVEEMGSTFREDPDFPAEYTGDAAGVAGMECKPGEVFDVDEKPIDAFRTLKSDIRKHIYNALIIGTLMPIVSMMFFISSLGFLSQLGGATVDVAALTRLI